ncbi:hypothetical protein CLV96_0787 [Leptospira meyeri]|uniref:Uncharacterized protein n=1 Tax=Leptospira meyeri TaxID=29508 RepID=A0A4R8MRF1_LEPME|nr:hypothetical protein [Leptospira meyeri]EKJ85340.1 hypothetical protein LEP1GSC017_3175 [Leptospira meyeri serovar Hardjo str. Went 5]TDY71813.1 hypothetical protein CLV96_0787 [Leptospira meyeri]
MFKYKIQNIFFYLSCFLWIANDSIFKILFPGWVTGKISDLIGLIFTPIIFTGILSLFTKKINSAKLFWFSVLLTNLIFISINLSQIANNYFYALISSNESFNLADKSDLFLLPIVFLSIYFFNRTHIFFQTSIQKRITILILPCLALLNTSYPQGRSNIKDIILLLGSAHSKIIQLEPMDIDIAENEFTFKFRFIGKDNENTPVSVEISNDLSVCPSPAIPPKENGNGTIFYSDDKQGKFQNYKIDISKSRFFDTIEKSSDCTGTECTINLQTLSPGLYFWNVRTRYLYLSDCQLYLENFLVHQEVHSFRR